MNEFNYQKILSTTRDITDYNLISSDYINIGKYKGNKILEISYEGLEFLSEKAFTNISHLLRKSHLTLLKKIICDDSSSENDKYVVNELLKNSEISSKFTFPMCQDTGTAIVMGKKGQLVWTGFCDQEAISKGVYNAYVNGNLRYSQVSPISMYDEINTNTNLPAQIDIEAVDGAIYDFLFIAKGGGSANKTFLFQENKSILNPKFFLDYICSKIKAIGTSACPPYHLAVVVGGTSAEFNLKVVKLASAGYLDNLYVNGNKFGSAFRDIELEEKILDKSRFFGIGAQFGGKYFCHDVRVVRLPRHGASCPIGIGVSCSADRNVKAIITYKGIYLENLETNVSIKGIKSNVEKTNIINVDLNKSIDEICTELNEYSVSTRLKLSGRIVVARDIAHSKIKKLVEEGMDVPSYFRTHVIYYAGPSKTPKGYASGSFGPTTSGRMDSYLAFFQSKGASLITLGKGNRSSEAVKSCKNYGGFYLGSIGGAAAKIGKNCIKSVEVIDYHELGMESVFMIEVQDFPAFVLIDNKGNDFFSDLF